MRRSVVAVAAVVCGALVFAHAAPARAQANANDVAAAEVLFEQGKKLMADGRFAEACPKLVESNRLDAGIGTELYLGDCFEKSGQTASAWAIFGEAATLAHKLLDPREKIAADRVARLEPKLSKLVVDVPQANRVAGLEVRRDGSEVGTAEWGVELPIDPGPHEIVAEAAGHKPWKQTFEVAKEKGRAHVDVPALASIEATPPLGPEPPGPPSPEGPPPGRTQRTIGIVVAVVGLAGVGVGTGFGMSAMAKASDAKASCDGAACADQGGVDARNAAKSRADVASVGFIAGGVAIAVGAVLYFTAPRARRARVGVSATGGDFVIGF